MKLSVVSLYHPLDYTMLEPTPSVTEVDHISEALKADTSKRVTDLFAAGTLTVLASYRGHMLYCTGGVTVHRYSPQSEGGNGYARIPDDGSEEDVIISTCNEKYKAKVKFFS